MTIMVVEPEKCDQIYKYTLEEWQPLLDLIPIIEETTVFSEVWEHETSRDQTIKSPLDTPAKIVQEFLDIVYSIPIIIAFDWARWDKGREMTKPDFNLDSADLVAKCKLVTAIVRNDRFCEGALISAFESGLILRILKSIENDVRN